MALCFILLDGDRISYFRDLRCSVYSLLYLTLQGFYNFSLTYDNNGNFTSGFCGSLPLIVAGGDVPPIRFSFDRMVFNATFIVRKTLWLVQGSVR